MEQNLFEKLDLYLEMQSRQTQALERIADAVRFLSPASAPNYQYPLEKFIGFDWDSISAVVEVVDQFGPSIVSWANSQFLRRSPANQLLNAIWFSRCTGRDELGGNKYDRLITFRPGPTIEVLGESRQSS